MHTKLLVKICGMREANNCIQLDALNVDLMGFIFYNQSKRFVGEHFVMPPVNSKRVGVFVDALPSYITSCVLAYQLDYVQLHGNESIEYVKALKPTVGLIKAFSLHEATDFNDLALWEPCVEYFLFDTQTPFYGGSGKKFDWSLLTQYAGTTPFFLSGGIHPCDVPEIKKIAHPALAGIDVNSGVEVAPGVKDVIKIRQMLNELNHANR